MSSPLSSTTAPSPLFPLTPLPAFGYASPFRSEAAADGPRATLGAALARAYAPSTPEIMDCWLAADGSH